MPKARSTKRETKRPGPYNLRVAGPVQTSSSMATAMASSPMHAWSPHHQQPMWPDPHMGYHQPYSYMPVSAPPPPPPHQPLPQPSHPGQSAPWTSEEDSALIDAKGAGLGWNEIHQRYFPNKSGNACRKRHERLMTKLRTTDWDHTRIQAVMTAYNAPRTREEFWGRIARIVGERWEDVEKVCFQQGLKGLRTTQPSHSRGRSTASSGLGATSDYDHHSNGDYEAKYAHSHDDSGIGLEAPGGHSRRSSQVHIQHPQQLEHIIRPGQYEYN